MTRICNLTTGALFYEKKTRKVHKENYNYLTTNYWITRHFKKKRKKNSAIDPLLSNADIEANLH